MSASRQRCLFLRPGQCRLDKQRCSWGCHFLRPDSESDLQLVWWIKRKSNNSFQLFREHHAWHERDPESLTDHRKDRRAITGLIANMWPDPARLKASRLHELKCALGLFHDQSFFTQLSGSYCHLSVQTMSRRNEHTQLVSRNQRTLNPLRGEEHEPDINDAALNPLTHFVHRAFKEHHFHVRILLLKTG